MPTTSGKGFVTPTPTEDNPNHTDLQAVAQRSDDILTARTAAAITALSGTDLWEGRIDRQTDGTGTSTRQQSGLYVYSSSAWKPLEGDGIVAATGGSPVLTAVTANPNMGTGPTQVWDWLVLGSWVMGHGLFKWGTGSPTQGTGSWLVPLPIAAVAMASPADTEAQPVGWGVAVDSSVPSSRQFILFPSSVGATTALMQIDNVVAALGPGAPLTLGATGDYIAVEYLYPYG